MPVPDNRASSVGVDFVGPLPEDDGCNAIATISCRLGSDYRFIPCRTDVTAEKFAVLFFDYWYCENGLPEELVIDQDKLWMSKFWKHLMLLTGIKAKASSSYHPESDGLSERTNKTMIQALRFHVECNQKGWKHALPCVRLHIMSTVNKSTGFTGFQLHMGRNPRLLLSFLPPMSSKAREVVAAHKLIEQINNDVQSARDNLMVAKVLQVYFANDSRANDTLYKVGDLVMMSTVNRRKQYMKAGNKGEKRAAKFVPRFDGPYKVTAVHTEASTVTLHLPNSPDAFPTFHTSLIKPFRDNDGTRFPSRSLEAPGPIVVDGFEEYFVKKILDHAILKKGNFKYLVQWKGEGPGTAEWIHSKLLEDNEAVDTYWKGLPGT